VDQLVKLIERPCWNHVLQRGIFRGLAATGEDRVVDILASYLGNTSQHLLMRTTAAGGLSIVGNKRHLYSEEARQRAVTALINALEHDSWASVRGSAARALQELGEKRAIGVLEHVASRETETRVQREMRIAVQALRTGDKADEQLKELRNDLDKVREENRKLKEQLGTLEARIK
jgi:aminopeptidase N